MTHDPQRAARRILNHIGEESRVPFFNVDEGDVGVLIAFPVVGLFTAGLTGMDSLAFPFIVAGLGIGAAIVYVTPDHLNAWQWFRDVYRYAKRPRVTFSAPAEVDSSRTGDNRQNEGGLANYTPFKPDERTQDLTNIDRAWPGAGAVQRTDGAMEAMLELSPGNMDFAMSGDWATLQAAGEEFANKELDFPLKFHATTQTFPVEPLVERIDGRLTHVDVTQNPVFHDLLSEYRETRPREMRDRGLQEVRYFVGVEVNHLEVYDRFDDERTPIEKLTTIPVIGFLFNPFVTRREHMEVAERRAKMFEKLDERIEIVRRGLVQDAAGWSARRLSTVELLVLAMDFWNGETHEYGDSSAPIREQPLVGAKRREDRDE